MAQNKSPSAIGTGMNLTCNTKKRWKRRDSSFAEHHPTVNWSKSWNSGIIPGLSPASFIRNFRPNQTRLTPYFVGLSRLASRIQNSDQPELFYLPNDTLFPSTEAPCCLKKSPNSGV